jgi:hypothetical protein
MKKILFVTLVFALLCIGFFAFLVSGPDAETGKSASELMMALFSKSESLAESTLPKEAVLISHGRTRKLSKADFERLHLIFSQNELSGSSPEIAGIS